MEIFIIKKRNIEVTGNKLADTYLAKHPNTCTVSTDRLVRWAKQHYKSDVVKMNNNRFQY